MSNLRDNLRRLMVERGFNQKSLSLAAGKNETAVRDILERARNPRQDTLAAIAEALGVSVSDLVGYCPFFPLTHDGKLPIILPSTREAQMSVTRYILAEVYNQVGTAICEIECDAAFDVDRFGEVCIDEITTDFDGKTIALRAGDPGYECALALAERMLSNRTDLGSIEEDLYQEFVCDDDGLDGGRSAFLRAMEPDDHTPITL